MRRRLTAEDAREEILRVAEKKLLEVGPAGLRLQDIAKDAGLSHPTVLHHFGSRAGLVDAVVSRAMSSLERDLLATFAGVDPSADPEPLTKDVLARVDESLRKHGYARLLAWLALSNVEDTSKESHLRDLARVVHEVRKARGVEGSLEDVKLTVMLTAATMTGLAIIGDGLAELMDLPVGDSTHAKLHELFTGMLVDHLNVRGGARAPETTQLKKAGTVPARRR